MEIVPEIMWRTYEDISGWIKFSDTKASAILASNGAILVIVFSKSIDKAEFLLDHKILLSIISLGFLSGLVSIFYAMRCLNPIFDQSEPKSLIYFAHIAKNYDNYFIYKIHAVRAFENDSELHNQIAYQVWANSKVALKKYINVSWALRFFIGQISFFTFAGIELVFISIQAPPG